MEFSKVAKVVIVVGLLAFGWIADGSWKGAVAWGILYLCVRVLWAFIHHEPTQTVRPTIQTVANFKEEVQTPAIRGKRNPDPTRPTTDDYMGMATNYIESNRGRN